MIELPKPVLDLYEAHRAMCQHFSHPLLKFTLDGRLLGDIGEALVADAFGITLCEQWEGGVDGRALDGRTVQIKATQDVKSGPSYTPGKPANHLIFVWLDFGGIVKRGAHVLYNGPEEAVRSLIRKSAEDWKFTITLRRGEVRALDAKLSDDQRLPRIR